MCHTHCFHGSARGNGRGGEDTEMGREKCSCFPVLPSLPYPPISVIFQSLKIVTEIPGLWGITQTLDSVALEEK